MADSAILEGLLTVGDAAAELHVSRSTVYRMIGVGKLADIEHGGRKWIERTELYDYRARARSAGAKKRTDRAKQQRPRARVRAPQASLAALLNALDGVALSDGERATLTLLAGFETSIVKNLAAMITRARQTR